MSKITKSELKKLIKEEIKSAFTRVENAPISPRIPKYIGKYWKYVSNEVVNNINNDVIHEGDITAYIKNYEIHLKGTNEENHNIVLKEIQKYLKETIGHAGHYIRQYDDKKHYISINAGRILG